jgi:hypothetical protein
MTLAKLLDISRSLIKHCPKAMPHTLHDAQELQPLLFGHKLRLHQEILLVLLQQSRLAFCSYYGTVGGREAASSWSFLPLLFAVTLKAVTPGPWVFWRPFLLPAMFQTAVGA